MSVAISPNLSNGGVSSSSSSLSPSSSSLDASLVGIQPIPINTIDFLNSFHSLTESKLNKISQQIQKLEITVALLEAKLNSIEWLTNGTNSLPNTSTISTSTQSNASASSSTITTSVPTAPSIVSSTEPSSLPSSSTPSDSSVPVIPASPAAFVALKDDPRYSLYFKLLSRGVPAQALKMKMQQDGIKNPEVIEMDPEGPAPLMTAEEEKEWKEKKRLEEEEKRKAEQSDEEDEPTSPDGRGS